MMFADTVYFNSNTFIDCKKIMNKAGQTPWHTTDEPATRAEIDDLKAIFSSSLPGIWNQSMCTRLNIHINYI